MMPKRRVYLLLTVLLTLLFLVLVTIGSYLMSIHSKGLGIVVFLFAFVCVMGQMASLALFLYQVNLNKIQCGMNNK